VPILWGGGGIDLTAAADAVYFSQTWSLGEYDQSLARLHRPGQRRNVTYHHLLADDSVDLAVREALAKRQDMVEAILSGLKQPPRAA
jgi:SNF2 family DNA or RNA helicase